MESYYPTHLFIEMIEGVKGIHPQTTKSKDDVFMRYYVGLKGSTIMIDCSDEDLAYTVCGDYCKQLGLLDFVHVFEEHVVAEEAPDEEGEASGSKQN